MGPRSIWARRDGTGDGGGTAFRERLWGREKSLALEVGMDGWPEANQQIYTFLSLAPEVVGRQRYGRPVDCWAIGVIMYIL